MAHIVAFAVVMWLCRRCCCRRAAVGDGPAKITAELGQLQCRKRLSTSYLLWFALGIVGAHHFYLERLVHGLVACWTMNFMGFGWLVDAVLMRYYVRGFNSRRAAPEAPKDTSRRRLLCRLPALVVGCILAFLVFFVYTPCLLHRSGIVDIDRIAAQTEVNPYDLLAIPRGADLSEAKSAYRKASLRWHPDRNIGCGRECELKMSEITRAFDVIKKRQAPSPDRTWQQWLEDTGSDWQHVIEAFSGSEQKQESEKQDASGAGGGRARGGRKKASSTEL